MPLQLLRSTTGAPDIVEYYQNDKRVTREMSRTVPYTRKRRYNRRRTWGNRKMVMYKAPSNYRTGGYVGLENKFNDSSIAGTVMPISWTLFNPVASNSLTAVPQGDGPSDRDGRVYHINSFHIKGQLASTTLTGQPTPCADLRGRIIIGWDTQTNEAGPLTAEVIDFASGGAPNDFYRELSHSKRFRILYDKSFIIRRSNSSTVLAGPLFACATTRADWSYNHHFKKPIKVICSGTTKSVNSISDNNFFLMAVTNITPDLLISYTCRTRFSG